MMHILVVKGVILLQNKEQEMIRAVQKAQVDEIGEDELQQLEKDVEEDSTSEEEESMADVQDLITSTN